MGKPIKQDEPKIPKWLKAELFEEILRQNITDFKAIKDFRVAPGIGAGENYATIMLRIEIDAETRKNVRKTSSLMLKVPHTSDLYKDAIKKNNIFDIERTMYLNIVPEMEQFYQKAGVNVKFGASAYYLNVSEDYVLLEDLRPKGFKNANRFEGLDVDHTEAVLKKLAQWHAASAVRVATKGAYDSNYVKGFFNIENRNLLDNFAKGVDQTFLKCLLNYRGHERYIEDVRKIQSKVLDELYKMDETDPNDFNVLNHGDLWTNNIMFQYDELGKIKETFFVDLQIPKYGTIAQDLLYFLLSSTSLDIKLSKFEYFIRYYHEHLVENLKLLKYEAHKIPTLKSIHSCLYKYGAFAYFSVIIVMGAVLLDPNEDANFDSYFETNEQGIKFKNAMYSNPRYQKHMEEILPWLQNRGALE